MFGASSLWAVARQLWPSTRPDGSASVAVRLSGPSPNLAGVVQGLLASWEAEAFKAGRDLLEDLERSPWVESADDRVDVVFEGRPGSRLWKDWMVWFTSYVRASNPEVKREAFVDRVSNRVRPAVDPGPSA